MLFNTAEFLVFFIVVTMLFFLLPHKFRWFHLLIASCYFYASFVPIYILILFFTIIIDYFAGIFIERATGKSRGHILLISIVANVSVLAFFKYYNFFIENVNDIFSFLGTSQNLPFLNILLPIGLSFHTFQAMSYTIEVYKGNQKAEKHFGIYALYVMFYPQLVAGPIERPQNILHQFHKKQNFSASNLWIGLRLMLWGLFKKVVVADRLSIFVDRVFDNPSGQNSIVLALGAVFFAIQIYCDFSGYSDMAIGAARTMGFNLMTNFNRPYFATNIKNFWDRWHISLSTWFRDYVYIPLGGNRVKVGRLYFNIAVVFLLSGLWHGANWTFIVWGALHVMYLFAYMFISRNIGWNKISTYKGFPFFAWMVTFTLVCFAWVFFRAENVDAAVEYIGNFFYNLNKGFDIKIPPRGMDLGFGATSYLIAALSIAVMFIVEYRFHPRLEAQLSFKTDIFFCSSILVLVFTFGVFQKNSFIYFQF